MSSQLRPNDAEVAFLNLAYSRYLYDSGSHPVARRSDLPRSAARIYIASHTRRRALCRRSPSPLRDTPDSAVLCDPNHTLGPGAGGGPSTNIGHSSRTALARLLAPQPAASARCSCVSGNESLYAGQSRPCISSHHQRGEEASEQHRHPRQSSETGETPPASTLDFVLGSGRQQSDVCASKEDREKSVGAPDRSSAEIRV